METILLLTQSAKYMLSIFETKYNIDINDFKNKLKNKIETESSNTSKKNL